MNIVGRIVCSEQFGKSIAFLMFVDLILIGMPWSVPGIKWMSLAVILSFTVEFVLKIVGLGPRLVFLDPWNMFDVVVNLFALVTFWIAPGLACLRGIRSARAIRMLRFAKPLKRLVHIAFKMANNFWCEFTSSGHGGIALLMILLFFIYLFGAALTGEIGEDHPEAVGNLPKAMWMALLIGLLDGEGLAFIRWCADERKYLVFFLCILNLVLVGFGILNGLIGVFGTAFCLEDEEYDLEFVAVQDDIQVRTDQVASASEAEEQSVEPPKGTKSPVSNKLFGVAENMQRRMRERCTEATLEQINRRLGGLDCRLGDLEQLMQRVVAKLDA